MNIHEYQAKDILKSYGVKIQEGIVADTPEKAVEAAKTLNQQTGTEWYVVKAQIHAGGRGKGGGVKLAKSLNEVEELSKNILGMQLVTHQTGPVGKEVHKVLITEDVYYPGESDPKEFYMSILLDRSKSCNVIMASTEGGMDIEQVAANTPEKIYKEWIDPRVGLQGFQARNIAFQLGLFMAISAGIYKVCEKAQNDLNEKTLKAISAWIQNLDMPGDINNWPKTFVAWFDSVFGTDKYSMKFFLKSGLTSLLASLFMFTLWLVLRPEESVLLHFTKNHALIMALYFFVFNLIPDYLSLIETRVILKFMAKTPSMLRHMFLLLVDFGITFFITLFIPVYIRNLYGGSYSYYFTSSLPLSVLDGVGFGMPDLPLQSIFFYTSFFTSVWVWFYSLAGIIIKLLARIESVFDRIKSWFIIDERPVTFLAYIAILLVWSVFIFLFAKPAFRGSQSNKVYQVAIEQRMHIYEMIREGLYDLYINPSGVGVRNEYTLQVDSTTIFDAKTNLTWQQSGSPDVLNYDNAKKYVAQLNASRFAGYPDWRLPTLEEAMSLMEPLALNRGLHVDPVFDGTQERIWTSEKQTASTAWSVSFPNGSCYYSRVNNSTFVPRSSLRTISII